MPRKLKKQKVAIKSKKISNTSINNIQILNINEYTVKDIMGDGNCF